MGTIVLLDLMGGVALLLWGLHMVQSGIVRAFGSDLRRVLLKALSNRTPWRRPRMRLRSGPCSGPSPAIRCCAS
jgi:hypothetical protein